jgi:hypothetical protein
MLEEAIFEMDEVIVSTAFNKMHRKRHESRARKYQKFTTKRNGHFIDWQPFPEFLKFLQEPYWKPVIRGLSGNRLYIQTFE